MDIKDILARIATTEAPLARQMLMTGLITRVLEDRGKPAPVLVGGLALSYYTREVYFTADIDLAYVDGDALDAALRELDFVKKGRYWIHEGLDMAAPAPASALAGEDAPRETVEIEGGLRCVVVGLEDLIIDRMNACKHWQSEVDCEMAELLIVRYREELEAESPIRPAGTTRQRTSVTEMLLLRDRLGLRRFKKTAKRDAEKRKLLLELALKRIEKAERDNFIQVGFRRRRVRFPVS